jgi:hypothetical protein
MGSVTGARRDFLPSPTSATRGRKRMAFEEAVHPGDPERDGSNPDPGPFDRDGQGRRSDGESCDRFVNGGDLRPLRRNHFVHDHNHFAHVHDRERQTSSSCLHGGMSPPKKPRSPSRDPGSPTESRDPPRKSGDSHSESFPSARESSGPAAESFGAAPEGSPSGRESRRPASETRDPAREGPGTEPEREAPAAEGSHPCREGSVSAGETCRSAAEGPLHEGESRRKCALDRRSRRRDRDQGAQGAARRLDPAAGESLDGCPSAETGRGGQSSDDAKSEST